MSKGKTSRSQTYKTSIAAGNQNQQQMQTGAYCFYSKPEAEKINSLHNHIIEGAKSTF